MLTEVQCDVFKSVVQPVHPTATLMVSKYKGWCKSCKSPIAVGSEILWAKGEGARHATQEACDKATAAKAAPQGHANLASIISFIVGARDRGIKWPKLRVLDADGTSELVLGLTGEKSKVPGSVTVKRDGEYLGLVRPTGDVIGAWDHPERFDATLIAHLAQVAEAPAIAAKDYAGITSNCSFCGKTLTDTGSVEVGYGPICAEHWGLPHTPKGTPALEVVV
jgi:hypothetical protein